MNQIHHRLVCNYKEFVSQCSKPCRNFLWQGSIEISKKTILTYLPDIEWALDNFYSLYEGFHFLVCETEEYIYTIQPPPL